MAADVGRRLTQNLLARVETVGGVAGPTSRALLSIRQPNKYGEIVIVVTGETVNYLDDLMVFEVERIEVGEHESIANVAADSSAQCANDLLRPVGVAKPFRSASEAVISLRHTSSRFGQGDFVLAGGVEV